MLAKYKTKRCPSKTKVANQVRAKESKKVANSTIELIPEELPDRLPVESDSEDSSSSSSDDEYEEMLLGAMDGYAKVKPESVIPVPEHKVPKTPVESVTVPVVGESALKKPKTKKQKNSRKKIVVKNYYMNKPSEVKNTVDIDKTRRISYIGMGSMPTPTTALRNRIINF